MSDLQHLIAALIESGVVKARLEVVLVVLSGFLLIDNGRQERDDLARLHLREDVLDDELGDEQLAHADLQGDSAFEQHEVLVVDETQPLEHLDSVAVLGDEQQAVAAYHVVYVVDAVDYRRFDLHLVELH